MLMEERVSSESWGEIKDFLVQQSLQAVQSNIVESRFVVPVSLRLVLLEIRSSSFNWTIC